LISFLSLFGMNSSFAVDHGSMKETGAALYPQRNGAAPGTAVDGVALDFKVVTIGTNTWAWTDLSAYAIGGDGWASQLRWWQPGKTENNLTSRVAGTRQTYGKTSNLPAETPVTITFFQALSGAPVEFTETDDFTYDYTAKNSAVAGDASAPVLADPVIAGQDATSVSLTLSATDDSGDYFYYISDAASGFETVSFIDNITIALVAGQAYDFSIVAIDFSGNTSAAKTVSIGAAEITNIVEGIARDVKFKLDSRSLEELVIFVENNDYLFGDAFVKLEINGAPVSGEKKPTITNGTHAYRVVYSKNEIPGWEEDAILKLNLGYIAYPVGDWSAYVMENTTITSGENAGKPILHKIGTGTDITYPAEVVQVDILPKTATITEGRKVQFTAVAKTLIGDPVPDTPVTWSVNSEDASISESGEFTSSVVGAYIVTATVTGTEITNTASVTVEELSLVSAYCDYPIGTGNSAAKISFSTRRDGRVVIEITPNDPEAETETNYTAFRNLGWVDAIVTAITVNGDANTGNKYFTRTHNGANDGNHDVTKTKLILTPVEGMMDTGDVIFVNNAILEYETPLNDNAYPNITFSFIYGSYCGELETLPEVASVTEGTVSDTEASVTVTATQGTYALATVNFTEDDAKISTQSFPVSEDNSYTIAGLTPETDYSFTITVTDIDGNKSDPFATKWTFTTAEGIVVPPCNLLDEVELQHNPVDDVFYATTWDWVASENYTSSLVDKTLSVHLGDATVAQWQAQFSIRFSEPVYLVPGETYTVSLKVKTTKNTPVLVKVFDTNNDVFLTDSRQEVNSATGTKIMLTDLVCPEQLMQISKILFDFAPNQADTDIEISEIGVCGPGRRVAIANVKEDAIGVYPVPATDVLNIKGLNVPAKVKIMDVVGNTVNTQWVKTTVDISSLSSGIYFITVNNRTVKFIKK
jgi:hypothetical protein